MKTQRTYLISGVGYTIEFESIKQRNAFKRLYDEIFNSVYDAAIKRDWQKYEFCLSKVIADKMACVFKSHI
jgi:hypothetical protein